MTTARDVTEPQLEHLMRCLDRSIGTDARSTMMTMLSAADVSDLATKADLSMLGLRLDEMEKRTEIRLDELDKRLNGRIDELDKRLNGRIDELDRRLTGQIETLQVHFDQKLEILENKISTNTMRAINRHLTFSVTAMSAISGMITVLAR
jgi:tetrahydromethanopterin S-methyltransferase subunit G